MTSLQRPGTTAHEVTTPAGVVTLIRLDNSSGGSVILSSLGAGITSLTVPDRNGTLRDIVLGYDNPSDYLNDGPCCGKTPGRYANRISNARFTLQGRTYRLTPNDGCNTLHGGPGGFHNRIWDFRIIPRGVEFHYLSPDGEEGYPGTLRAGVRYLWDESNTLRIEIEATTEAPTVVNLTNHAYFNLHGPEEGSILNHRLRLNASRRVVADATDIPTGEIATVSDTPFDFRGEKEIGYDINEDFENLAPGKGYNHYFLIDGEEGTLRSVAHLSDNHSGIRLEVATTYPGLMLYSGNWLADSPPGKGGIKYRDHDGVALECQYPPDAPNRANFPQATLLPGETYRHIIEYRVSTF